jgi:hypothetical protein
MASSHGRLKHLQFAAPDDSLISDLCSLDTYLNGQLTPLHSSLSHCLITPNDDFLNILSSVINYSVLIITAADEGF